MFLKKSFFFILKTLRDKGTIQIKPNMLSELIVKNHKTLNLANLYY